MAIHTHALISVPVRYVEQFGKWGFNPPSDFPHIVKSINIPESNGPWYVRFGSGLKSTGIQLRSNTVTGTLDFGTDMGQLKTLAEIAVGKENIPGTLNFYRIDENVLFILFENQPDETPVIVTVDGYNISMDSTASPEVDTGNSNQ